MSVKIMLTVDDDEFCRQRDRLAVAKFSKSKVWYKVPQERTLIFWRFKFPYKTVRDRWRKPPYQQDSHKPQTPPRCCHLELLSAHVIFLSLHTQGRYVQAWCHKYSTRPLRPKALTARSSPERSLHSTQRVFLRAKPEPAWVWASLPQPGGDVEHRKNNVIRKTGNT